MKRFALLFMLMPALVAVAQEAVTGRGSLNIVKEVKPPILSVVEGSVRFVDATGNNAIDANEACSVEFDIQNSGMGDATGCVASVQVTGASAGISGTSGKRLPLIPVGAKQHVSLPLTGSMKTIDGTAVLKVSVTEPLGFGITPFELSVTTHAFEEPLVKIADYALRMDNGNAKVQKTQPFKLEVALQNVKSGDAEKVGVDIKLPDGVFLLSSNAHTAYETLEGGQAKKIVYNLIVNNAFEATDINVQLAINEKFGKYAENKTINIPLNVDIAEHRITINESARKEKKSIDVVTVGSDVDKNIPVSKSSNSRTYVLIIANERYQEVEQVPFALHDGEVFRQYCELALGVPANHIKMYSNATYNNMRSGVAWISEAMAVNADAEAIVYYTGHGIPDEASKASYLLPVDGTGKDTRSAYPLNEFYQKLGETGRPVTVFLDACFSGAQRDGAMLAQAKGVAIKAKPGTPQGKTVVFSAATGDETAGFYRKQEHGMFTYWLLKEIQATEGNVTYEQLNQSLYNKVRATSFDENNGKIQTPTVANGSEAADWRQWTLK